MVKVSSSNQTIKKGDLFMLSLNDILKGLSEENMDRFFVENVKGGLPATWTTDGNNSGSGGTSGDGGWTYTTDHPQI
jgi:hypothetical protein